MAAPAAAVTATSAHTTRAPEPLPAALPHRRCPLAELDQRLPDHAASLMAAVADCTARSRNQTPLQSCACQPLGAWHCAVGFQGCLPRIDGGNECLAHFNRFREQQGFGPRREAPLPTGPDAVSVDDGSHRLQARFDTCLGDHHSHTALDASLDVSGPYQALAATPSFVGNQSNGWDAMFVALLRTLKPSELPLARSEGINLVMGFEHFAENYRILRLLLEGFGLHIQYLSDPSGLLDAKPLPHTNPGGTRLETLRSAPGALDTLLIRPWQLSRTRELISERWGHGSHPLPIPMGLAWTDAWLHYLSKLTGNEVPALLQLQRHQLCEAIHHALPLLCRLRFAVYGEPDFVMGISRYLIELGAGPTLILCQNGNRRWKAAMEGLLTDCGYQREVAVHIGAPPEAVETLLQTKKPDLLIAPPALRADDRDPAGLVPGLRRVQLERPSGPGDQPSTLGYAGARHLLNAIVDAVVSRG